MNRRKSANQLDLFATPAPSTPAPARQCPPARGRKPARSSAGNPAVARDVLAEVHTGRYGLLDDTDRIVVFDDDQHVRMALDEDAITNLVAQGYVERSHARDTVSCRHGAIRRPVLPLRLTKNGRETLLRWSAYTPLGSHERR